MITEEQIQQGLDKAYKKAGHNAYFGNGFKAGVEFALKAVKNNSVLPLVSIFCGTCGCLLTNQEGRQYCKDCRKYL